ncbi:MAG: hypothetical protein R2698_14690 [Microthrixaceae bacterium]
MNPSTKLAGFVAALALTFLASFGIGTAVGSDAAPPEVAPTGGHVTVPTPSPATSGAGPAHGHGTR